MDDFERKLKRDAGAIPAELTPGREARIRAALAAEAPRRERSRHSIPYRAWLAASLTGAAAAVLVVTLLPRVPEPQPAAELPPARTVPEYVAAVDRALPLKVEPAEFTAPLEQELRNLRADLEQARRSVAEDMAF